MRQVLFILIAVFVLAGCTQAPLENQHMPKRFEDQPIKRDVPSSFFTGSQLVPLENNLSITEIVGWFDDGSILYLEEQGESSTLYQYNLHTSESSPFLQLDGWIIDVQANADYSLFAVQQVTLNHETNLIIVDRDGDSRQIFQDYGEEYVVYWNPYKEDTFIMVAFLPDWEFETYVVTDTKVKELSLDNSYVQWISEKHVGYLKWEELEPSFQAPLYEVNVENSEERKWKESVIAYMSFPDTLSLTVTVDSVYELYSTYTFYDEQKPFREIEMPILNTYSEQWWIPFYTYDVHDRVFYYLRPKHSSDFFSYDEGFDLIAYYVDTDAEEKLATFDKHVPLRVSPSGGYLLIGDRFESVFDLSDGAIVSLLEE
ncbi:hypothetical protein JCM9140_729 [Halalkalibacter wakoensis JCM 9140]|uniref:YqgU-like 6-bladed beta-propeller domain-containing protein n=1 Tax=Halalkalibacter wakoensis JCM 9140 TaxID=1236970 RepID=W4PYG9_9BACI|nr:hypothetical protein [Halalkalibacter wakoensis]GAE24777.1 hypothetical protein JCM9140_729 [Halalkalibacter wakoensis JCM 9140]